ncbi:uncharacterized protein LOC125652380 isoform X2 [Ostrea edulis]|uniref:uncharacterized protein LOC125652380 isoform X2 n=1 Tax=Ostrea edulis TaxID=37623 RepID=UPI0024AEDA76|nr:uncharacterized protein LOC125652380 isoform X2 [Ostrea edulis]XP_056021009.1 uncharacterized protein LOC125652380 isoform X2 [Ostrea edulis]XP_056021010.1 uncharacterized protein LOC125652380 isoform X2 [Ostrea edulis]
MMVEINICRLRPPELPKFRSPPTDSEQKMINIRDSSTSYQDYIKICGGGDSDGISPPFTESSSTPAQMTTTLQYVTTEVTNFTSSQNDTFLPPNISNLSYSSNDWIAGPVVVAIIVFFLLVILALFLIKKYKGRNGQQLYDLQTHESVNYLNNKAEKGDKWGEAHETVNYLDNKAEKGEKWNGRNKNINGLDKEDWEEGHRNGAEKREKNIHTTFKTHNKTENGKVQTNETVNHSESSPKYSNRKMKDQEVIYANSQFEKVARADQSHNGMDKKSQLAGSLSFEIRDNTPPMDKKTQDMYYIDENPYDRVDQREKPVPKKRKKVLQ